MGDSFPLLPRMIYARQQSPMAKRHPSSRLMREVSLDLQDYKLPAGRAQVLAQEVGALNRAVLNAAQHIRFEDEPSNFLVVMGQAKRAPRVTKR